MNLEKLRNRHGKVWLNVGGSSLFLDDFVNVDSCFLYFLAPFYPAIKPMLKAPAREWLDTYKARRKPGNYVFANCRLPLDLPPHSVDHILVSHFLEHLYFEDATRVLRNYLTILRPGGTLHIIVPDVGTRAKDFVSQLGDPAATHAFVDWLNFQKPAMPRLVVRLLRATGMFDAGHCWLYDYHSMAKLVREVGFQILEKDDSPSTSWRRNDPCQVNILVQKPAV